MKPTVSTFRKMKTRHERIAMMTAYCALSAHLAESAALDALLVGDSMANTVLGYRNTLMLSLEESLMHAAAVRRGAPESFVIGDMPFMTYQASEAEALKNAARYLQEADCDAVKLEGGAEMAPLIHRMTSTGIPVMAHIGLLPQQVMTAGGYRIAGKTEDDAERLIADAHKVEEAGAFSVVLECMPRDIARRITESVSIPTIGIGAGAGCDGQIQVVTDLLGLGEVPPRHAGRYAALGEEIAKVFRSYVSDVKTGAFPTDAQSF